jgi:hypothetical protein
VTGVDVVTLCEEHYHPGLGALVNSLVAHGFAGTLWVGHRGPLPAWSANGHGPRPELAPAPGVRVAFVEVRTGRHLTNHKARFMREVLARHAPGADALLYLDPDIVLRHAWAFFPEWIAGGIAVCADVNPWFPASHPVRNAWRALARELGDDVDAATLDLYVNGGLVGVARERSTFLDTWERYTVAMAARGPGLGDGPTGHAPGPEVPDGRTSPWMTPDQDALNLACMAHAAELSLMGPQAMSLARGWPVVGHAIGSPKPWTKRFVRAALRGEGPTRADEAFLAHARGAVAALGPAELLRRRAALRLARGLRGRAEP